MKNAVLIYPVSDDFASQNLTAPPGAHAGSPRGRVVGLTAPHAVPDAQSLAVKGFEDIAIAAGAAIGALDAVVRRQERWDGVWRQRLPQPGKSLALLSALLPWICPFPECDRPGAAIGIDFIDRRQRALRYSSYCRGCL